MQLRPYTHPTTVSAILPMTATRDVSDLVERRGPVTASTHAIEQAIAELPAADLQLLRDRGIRVELQPVALLDQTLLGATTIEQDGSGRWRPGRVRIATDSRDTNVSPVHTAIHEIGHVVSVLRRQDRSELGAERYAFDHLPSARERILAIHPEVAMVRSGSTPPGALGIPRPHPTSAAGAIERGPSAGELGSMAIAAAAFGVLLLLL